MSNIVPEKGINFSVYLNGRDLLGVAEANFPNIEMMTSEVKGAGIAGVAESIVLGHVNSTTVSLTWRNTTKDFAQLLAHKAFDIDMYAAHQEFDAGLGVYVVKQIHIFMKAVTKSGNIGNLVVGETTSTQTEHEVYYIKFEINGKEVAEIDKFNYIYKVNGVDYLAEVRVALGKV